MSENEKALFDIDDFKAQMHLKTLTLNPDEVHAIREALAARHSYLEASLCYLHSGDHYQRMRELLNHVESVQRRLEE